jgi:hypothetical protein
MYLSYDGDNGEEKRMDEYNMKRRSIVTIDLERLTQEERERLEREEHVKQVAMNFRQRLKTRSERKKNRKREFARARALSAQRKWKGAGALEQEDTLQIPDDLDSPGLVKGDIFEASLNSIADLENDLIDVEKEMMNQVLPSAQSYSHRKEMTQHRVSMLMQDIHEDIRKIADNIDPRDLLDDEKDEAPKESYKRATMWTNLDPEHFQRSMPEISKDVPLDPPGQFKGGEVAGVSDDENHGEVVE